MIEKFIKTVIDLLHLMRFVRKKMIGSFCGVRLKGFKEGSKEIISISFLVKIIFKHQIRPHDETFVFLRIFCILQF